MATVTKEKLHCEIGNHNWTRVPTRGRKPANCPKHKPEPAVASNSHVTVQPNGMRILHCVNGKHDWEREPKRGRVPTSCPEHTTTPVIVSANRNENGKVTLHCEIGNHDWEREPQRGKRPTNCPEHNLGKNLRELVHAPRSVAVSVVEGSGEGEGIPVPKKRGRPKLHDTPEEAKEAQLEKSRQRANDLNERLKLNGVHISQAYVLYKKTGEKPSRTKGVPPTVTWERVENHSPLQMAQFVNKYEADFVKGLYRYEHNGKVINPLL